MNNVRGENLVKDWEHVVREGRSASSWEREGHRGRSGGQGVSLRMGNGEKGQSDAAFGVSISGSKREV